MVMVGLLAAITALLMRVFVWTEPSLAVAILFWGVFLVSIIGVRNLYLLPGIGCNAVATLANGGAMPVFGVEAESLTGIHIPGGSDTQLAFLCDIFWGASIGDFLILCALVFYGVRLIRRSASHPTGVRARSVG